MNTVQFGIALIFFYFIIWVEILVFALFSKRKMPVNKSAKAFFVSLNVEDENGEV